MVMTTKAVPSVQDAIEALLSVCDGATSKDFAGFNGPDSTYFRNLLSYQPDPKAWSPVTVYKAYDKLRKYRNQLIGLGVDYSAIPVPAKPASLAKSIELVNGNFVVKSPYNPPLIADIKRLPVRQYDNASRCWLVPANAGTLPKVKELAAYYGLEVLFEDDEVVTSVPAPAPVAPAKPVATIAKNGSTFSIKAPYNDNLRAECKVLGGYWDRAQGVWLLAAATESQVKRIADLALRFNLTPDAQAKAVFAKVAGDDLATIQSREQKAAELARVAAEQRKAAAIAASKAEDADIVVPGLNGQLRGFQRAGVKYATQRSGVLIADDMGTGKSLQALAAIQVKGTYPAMVVSPANVKYSWRQEVERWFPGRKAVVLETALTSLRLPKDIDFVILNYDILEPFMDTLLGYGFKAIVADESHFIKSEKAQRSVFMLELATGERYENQDGDRVFPRRKKGNVVKTVGQPIPFRLGLSGTVTENGPDELANQLEFLGMLRYFAKDQYTFKKDWCGGYEDQFGFHGFNKNLQHFDPARFNAMMTRLHNKLREVCMIRRTKAQVMPELPEKQITVLPVALSNQAEYDRAEAELIQYLKDQVDRMGLEDMVKKLNLDLADFSESDTDDVREYLKEQVARKASRAEHLVRIETLKGVIAKGKVAAAEEWIAEFLTTGQKLVVFATHTAMAKRLAKKFKAPLIIGGVSAKDRADIVDRFQHDASCRLVVLNLKAGNMGLTLTAASTTLTVELGWVPTQHMQAEDRVHRIGQTADSVNAYYLVAQDTLDMNIYRLLMQKRTVVEAVHDGKMVTDYRRGDIAGDLIAELTSRH